MKRRGLSGAAAVLYLFLYLPLAVVSVASINSSRFGTEWKGFTLEWYRTAGADPQVITALQNTLVLALASTAMATVLGTLLGYGLGRHSFKGKEVLSQAMLFPIAVPDIVMAVSLLTFYALLRRWTGFGQLGLGTMIISHVTFQIPFVAMVVRARLRGFDPALEHAAADLGATRLQQIWHVTLPLLRPGIVAGALLAFTLSLDDFVVSFFTSGPGSTTVPIYIYSAVKRGVTGEVHALSTILIMSGAIAAAVIALGPSKRITGGAKHH
jgi:spermidine/putrescine transport system permease protein